jgi:hypothetical protein
MITTVNNMDYLIEPVRMRLGDFEGTLYSDALIRTALVNSIKFLQKRWRSKYQILNSGMIAEQQPSGLLEQGYIWVSTTNGYTFLSVGFEVNDVFRNPFLEFDQPEPPVIEQNDEDAIILAAAYLVHLGKLTSSSSTFVSWSTEDIKYTNSESSKSMKVVLDALMSELNTLFKTRIAQPKATRQPLNIVVGTKVY